jgi:hypothetical protein
MTTSPLPPVTPATEEGAAEESVTSADADRAASLGTDVEGADDVQEGHQSSADADRAASEGEPTESG